MPLAFCPVASSNGQVRRWLLAGVLSSPLFAAAGLFDARDDAMVKERCSQEGRATGELTVADGIFETLWADSSAFQQAAQHVLERRFRYVEYERRRWGANSRPVAGGFQYHHFHEDLLGPETGEKYLRISAARDGDPRCEPFKHFVTRGFLHAHQLRWWGLPQGMCLAVERTDELRAPVEHVFVPDSEMTRRGMPRRGWLRYQERGSGRVIAQVWIGTSRGFSCFRPEEQRKLDSFVSSPGNPDLPDPPPIERVDRPQFPSRRIGVPVWVGPESPTVAAKQDYAGPKVIDYASWTEPGVLMDHGNTFLGPFYERSEGPFSGRGSAVGLAGHSLYIVRPGIRRQIPVADGALNFTTCDSLARLGGAISVSCRSRQEMEGRERWIWSYWLLLYADDGSPREHIHLDLAGGPFPRDQLMSIGDVSFPPDGSLRAVVRYQRGEAGSRRGHQVEAIFRLDKAE